MSRPRPSRTATLLLAALVSGCGASAAKSSTGRGGSGGDEEGTGGRGGGAATGGKFGGGGQGGGAGSQGSGGSSGATGGSGGSGTADGGVISPRDAAAGGAGGGGFPDAGSSGDAGPGPPPPPPMPNPCTVHIVPISPTRLDGLPVGSRLRVEATAAGPMAPRMPTWTWSVQHLNSGGTVTPTVIGMNTAVVEFPLATAGSYNITARASALCVKMERATAVNDPVAPFWLRVIPPVGANVQSAERIIVDVSAGRPVVRDLTLGIGFQVAIDPHAETAAGTPEVVHSYVRITGEGSTVRLEGHTRTRAFSARLNSTLIYNVLVIPDDPVAPFLFRGTPAQIDQNPFKVDPGAVLNGQVTSAKGPVPRTRILLRSGPVPSTTGLSADTGRFDLRARAGNFAAAIIPPPRSGLPEARLATNEGLVLYAPVPARVGLDFAWDPIATSTLDLTVLDDAGMPVKSPVRVRLESTTEALPKVGTLTLTLDQPYPLNARGYVLLDAVSTAAGAVSFTDVPRATYTATLTPVDGSAAITTVPVNLTGTTAGVTQTVRLTAKVTLSGKLIPASLSAGARVVALDAAADPTAAPPSAIVDSAGGYQLRIDPGRTYSLVLEPVPARSVPRTFLRSIVAPTKDSVREDMTVPTGVSLSGVVTDNAGMPIAGALVEAYCIGRPPSCIDGLNPDTTSVRPTAEAISDDTGAYRLLVPDPKIVN